MSKRNWGRFILVIGSTDFIPKAAYTIFNIIYAHVILLQGCLLYASALKSIASSLKSIASTLKSIACHQLCMHRHSSEYNGANTAIGWDHIQANSNKHATLVRTNHTDDSCCSVILLTEHETLAI